MNAPQENSRRAFDTLSEVISNLKATIPNLSAIVSHEDLKILLEAIETSSKYMKNTYQFSIIEGKVIIEKSRSGRFLWNRN